MKKVICIFFGGYIGIVVLVVLLMVGVAGGDAGGAAAPIQLFASEEEAYAYQYIGTELGVPWDIVLLADTTHAYRRGAENLKDYNPLYTSLEFCALVEEKYTAVIKEPEPEETNESEVPEGTEETGEAGETESAEDAEDEEAPADGSSQEALEGAEHENETEPEAGETQPVVIDWVREEIVTYSGRNEILGYLGMSDEDLVYQDATGIIVAVNEKAESKRIGNEVYYTITLVSEPDYENILKNRIGLSDDDISDIMVIFDSGYLPEVYGYASYYSNNIELPDIVVGNVSRSELAQVAVSLLGHPYLMGAKSSEQGAPKGPLDCSGYVDWVYVQCFGMTVSTGKLPEGVAVSGTAQQWFASEAVAAKDLKVGDLGFMRDPSSMRAGQVNHVGIYLGTYDGNMLWIHCGGSSYGTADSPKGRVGISKPAGYNNYNPVYGTTFEPAMKNCRFRYYRRPRFTFTDD